MAATITEYLDQLKDALKGADPALVQDALDDAETHLHSEVTAGRSVEEALADYGCPAEVARAYRENEALVEQHVARHRTIPGSGGFFSVWTDFKAWSSLLYFFVALFTSVVYFAWIITGLTTSITLTPFFLIGVPLFVLFMGSVRGLCLFEGILVENLLGVRMPRRKRYVETPGGLLETAKFWLSDGQTWKSLIYLLLTFPIAVVLFTLFVTLFSTGVGLMLSPLSHALLDAEVPSIGGWELDGPWTVVAIGAGMLLLTFTLNLAKWIGAIYGKVVKAIHVNRTVI